MIATATPIHTGIVNSELVRFFRGPGDAPDMPWHAHEDLLKALDLPRGVRRILRRMMLQHWRSHMRTVEVDGEPTLLAPHFVAQGLIGAAQEAVRQVGYKDPGPDIVDREYHRAGVAVMNALTAHLPDAQDRAAWAIEAFHAQGGGAA